MADSAQPGRPAVTLDLWLTLVAELDGSQRSEKRYQTRTRLAGEVLEGFGMPVPHDDLLIASRSTSEMITSDHDLGVDLEFTDRVAQMLALVDEELPGRLGDGQVSAVGDAVDRAFVDNPPRFLPGAKEVLSQLSSLDINVALISNTGLTSASAYRKWFEAEGVLDQFHELTFSNEIACAKPNPNIFCPTLDKVGSSPGSALHIGDNLLTDISGAAGVGMKTGWIAGYDNREPIVPPDYTLKSISDLPAIVEDWLNTVESSNG